MRDDLPHAMRETARSLEPDVVRLAAGGVSRGTRMRRVERIVQVLGSAVAVAAVFAGVALFGPRHGAGEGMTAGAGDGDSTNPIDASTSASAPPSTAPDTSTHVPRISTSQLIAAVKSRLDNTGVTGSDFAANGDDRTLDATDVPNSPLTVRATLSARHRVGFLGIVFSGPRDLGPPQGRPEPRRDGSIAYVQQTPGSLDGPNPTVITVTLVRPDGSSIAATETNSRTEKGPAQPGAPLLLNADQVGTLLDSSEWDAAIAAAEALPPGPPRP